MINNRFYRKLSTAGVVLIFLFVVVFQVSFAQVAGQKQKLQERLRGAIEERRASGASFSGAKSFFKTVVAAQQEVLTTIRGRIAAREQLSGDRKAKILMLFDARLQEAEKLSQKLETASSRADLESFIQEAKVSRDAFRSQLKAEIDAYLNSSGMKITTDLDEKGAVLEIAVEKLKKRLSSQVRLGQAPLALAAVDASQLEQRVSRAKSLVSEGKGLLQNKQFRQAGTALNQATQEYKSALTLYNQAVFEDGEAVSYVAGNYPESIMIDGKPRTYLLHIPTGYSPGREYPLVVVLHGGEGTGEKIMGQTKFDTKADQEGFIAVFPDGIDNGWADGRGTAEAEKQGYDDVKFIRQLVSHLQSKLSIDSGKIYATGVSNGGMMTYRLGCEAADLFDAIATDAANLPEPLKGKCNPSRPIPLVAINGLDDPLVPYNGGDCCVGPSGGGQGGRVLSTVDTVKIFANVNSCSLSYTPQFLPVVVNDGTKVEKRAYQSCPTGKDVISYVVHGMGHVWPPNESQLSKIITGPTSKNINATNVFWEFFKNHSNSIPPPPPPPQPVSILSPIGGEKIQRGPQVEISWRGQLINSKGVPFPVSQHAIALYSNTTKKYGYPYFSPPIDSGGIIRSKINISNVTPDDNVQVIIYPQDYAASGPYYIRSNPFSIVVP
ncbi:MAG: hypothetical protein HY456_00840 [Parcubacteria group bacterium]|nr:hypothetical protein [Parcubacteria group bacterium]